MSGNSFEEIESGLLGEFPYTIQKHPRFETLNGYLGIPIGHPWYGKNTSEIDASCHGGLTFSDFREEDEDFGNVSSALHIWWVGFDCGHAWDIIPGIEKLEASMGYEPIRFKGSSYKDRDYVYHELEGLAAQAAEAYQKGGESNNENEDNA